MNKIVVVGLVADALGHQLSRSPWLDERGAAHRGIDAAAVPAASYHVAKDRIPVEWRHRRHLGPVVHLERGDKLSAVAELDVDRLDDIDLAQPLFWSPEVWETRSRHAVEAELLAIGLTPAPASVALPAVRVLAGDLDTAARHATGSLAGILERAAQARRRRHYGDPIRIIDVGGPAVERSPDGNTFLHGEMITEKRTTPPLSDEARRLGIRRIEHSAHRGRIIAVR